VRGSMVMLSGPYSVLRQVLLASLAWGRVMVVEMNRSGSPESCEGTK
jgi:hypothetical protein